MANVFTSDGSCRALLKFEAAPGINQDSIGGNHLTMTQVTGEGVIIKEGAQSAKFVIADSSTASIADADLDVGFPLRFADTSPIADMTMCCWKYYATIPSVQGFDNIFLNKYSTIGDLRTFRISVTSSNDRINLYKGYNSGVSFETDSHLSALVAGRWYHLSYGYQENDKSYYIEIWDDTAGAIHGTTVEDIFLQPTSIRNVPLELMTNKKADVYIDEFVVWNVKKSLNDIAKVRAGTYDYINLSNLVPSKLGLNITRNLYL